MTHAAAAPEAEPKTLTPGVIGLIVLVVGASSLNYVDRQVLALLKPTLEAEFGWSNAEFAHLGSVFQLATAFSYLGVGWFVDRAGVRWSYALGVAAWSLAGMAHAAATTVQQFVAARVALAVGESVNTPAGLKAVATYVPRPQRAIALGIVNSAPNIGAILTPLAIPPLALAFGWHAAFLVTGALGFIWLAFWLPATRRLTPQETAPLTGVEKIALADVLKDRGTWTIVGAKAIFDQVWWFLLFWTPAFFASEFGMTQKTLGGPIALIYAMAAMGALSSGFAYEGLVASGRSRLVARRLSLLGYALLILPIALALQAQSPWIAAGLIGLALFAHQGFSTNVFGLTTDLVAARSVGKVISLAAFAGNLSGMAIIEFTGWSLDNGHGYAPMFAICSLAYLVAFAWIWLMAPRTTQA